MTEPRIVFKKRPTRRQLLQAITELQSLIGRAAATHGNDRDRNGFEKGQKALDEALKLCINAREFDPPTDI
jgi:hypothetical protein